MPSYYEVLKLESNASIEVIETAIDDQYNQFRGLVNHHDPNVVEQANRALRQLEDIRSTLTNPEKRALYDQTINFGGLADPTAILQTASSGSMTVTPPAPKPTAQDDSGLNAWKCSQCGKANRVGSKTCSNCGNVLARDCPNLCGSVVLLNEKYCSNCGKSVEEALGKLQIEFERAQKIFVDNLRTKLQSKRSELDRLNNFSNNVPVFSSNTELDQLVGEPVPAALGCGSLALLVIGAVIVSSIGSAIDRSGFLSLILFAGGLAVGYGIIQSSAKAKAQAIIGTAANQKQEYIRHAERRLKEEESNKFDPMSPKPFSPSNG